MLEHQEQNTSGPSLFEKLAALTSRSRMMATCVAGLSIFLLQGCSTLGVQTELKTTATWAGTPGQILLPEREQVFAFVQQLDSSGADWNSNRIEDKVRNSVEDKGWTIVNRPQLADYIILVELVGEGEYDPNKADLTSSAGILSALGGAAAGAVAQEATEGILGSGGSYGLGAGAGVLAGLAIHHVLTTNHYAILANVVIRRAHKDTAVQIDSADESGVIAGSDSNSPEGTASAGASHEGVTTESSATFIEQSAVISHQQLAVTASKFRLSEDDALDKMIPRFTRAISGKLPRNQSRGR